MIPKIFKEIDIYIICLNFTWPIVAETNSCFCSGERFIFAGVSSTKICYFKSFILSANISSTKIFYFISFILSGVSSTKICYFISFILSDRSSTKISYYISFIL